MSSLSSSSFKQNLFVSYQPRRPDQTNNSPNQNKTSISGAAASPFTTDGNVVVNINDRVLFSDPRDESKVRLQFTITPELRAEILAIQPPSKGDEAQLVSLALAQLRDETQSEITVLQARLARNAIKTYFETSLKQKFVNDDGKVDRRALAAAVTDKLNQLTFDLPSYNSSASGSSAAKSEHNPCQKLLDEMMAAFGTIQPYFVLPQLPTYPENPIIPFHRINKDSDRLREPIVLQGKGAREALALMFEYEAEKKFGLKLEPQGSLEACYNHMVEMGKQTHRLLDIFRGNVDPLDINQDNPEDTISTATTCLTRELAEEARLKVSETSVELKDDFRPGFQRGAATLVLDGDTQRLNDLIKQAPEMYDGQYVQSGMFSPSLKTLINLDSDLISDEATKHKIDTIQDQEEGLIVCPKEFLKPYFESLGVIAFPAYKLATMAPVAGYSGRNERYVIDLEGERFFAFNTLNTAALACTTEGLSHATRLSLKGNVDFTSVKPLGNHGELLVQLQVVQAIKDESNSVINFFKQQINEVNQEAKTKFNELRSGDQDAFISDVLGINSIPTIDQIDVQQLLTLDTYRFLIKLVTPELIQALHNLQLDNPSPGVAKVSPKNTNFQRINGELELADSQSLDIWDIDLTYCPTSLNEHKTYSLWQWAEALAKKGIDKDALVAQWQRKADYLGQLSGSRIGLTANNLHNIYLRLFVESNWMRDAGLFGAANSVSALMNQTISLYGNVLPSFSLLPKPEKLSCEKLTKAGVIAQLKETNAWSEITVREDSQSEINSIKEAHPDIKFKQVNRTRTKGADLQGFFALGISGDGNLVISADSSRNSTGGGKSKDV